MMVSTISGTGFPHLFHRLRFLKGNWRLLALWPAVALVITAIGWYFLLAHLDKERKAMESEALREATVSAASYSEFLSRTLEAIDEFSLYIRQAWELSHGTFRLDQLTQNKAVGRRWPFNVAIIAPNGDVVSSRTQLSDRVNVAGATFLEVQRNAAGDFLYISTPSISPLDNMPVVHFTRPLHTRDGTFAGVVMVCIPIDRLTASYSTAAPLGLHGMQATVGQDGAVRATRTGNETQPIGFPLLTSVPDLHTEKAGTLLAGGNWFTDSRARYVGWHAVDDFPLIAMAGVDQREKLAPYLASRRDAIRSALWATAVLMLFKFIAMGLTIRLAWRKHRMELAQATYRIATEEGSEGFYIARAISNAAGRVIDFLVVDCNQSGAEFFRLDRKDMIGQTVVTLYKGRNPERLMNALCYAHKHGTFDDEIEVHTKDLLTTRWLQLKIVRADGDLAVRVRDISAAKAHIKELERQASEDALTKLPNRQWVLRYLPGALDVAAAHNRALALLFLDLDGFKLVNDTMGHSAGDELLQLAARRLKLAVRPEDHVARLGGDEFVVIVEGVEHARDAGHVAERVLYAFRENFKLAAGPATIGTSIGISLYPKDGDNAEALLKNADIAMYSIKATGKGDYRFYNEHLYDALKQRMERETDLRRALDRDEFVVHYQPRADLVHQQITSMEALVRWQHPSKGLLHPADFIRVAEDTGLITPLGEVVLEKVCAQLARWKTDGRKLVPISVNVSPRQFEDCDLPDLFRESLARHSIDPSLIEIELTESLMMADTPEVDAAIGALQAMGIRLVVDDFGTGYSSLSQLQRLDFDVLKVDKAFTAEIESSEQGNVFFSAIITMAHALGMRVVAEGVESQQQIRILQSLHCDELQGYFIAPPKPAEQTNASLPSALFAT